MTSTDRSATTRDDVTEVAVTTVMLLLLVAVVVWAMRDADSQERAQLIEDTQEPQLLEVSAGWVSSQRPTEELAAYFRDELKLHRGDTVRFVNPTVEDPHSVTFGLDSDRSNQPRFGEGEPLPNMNGPASATCR
jgi:plastocyanin